MLEMTEVRAAVVYSLSRASREQKRVVSLLACVRMAETCKEFIEAIREADIEKERVNGCVKEMEAWIASHQKRVGALRSNLTKPLQLGEAEAIGLERKPIIIGEVAERFFVSAIYLLDDIADAASETLSSGGAWATIWFLDSNGIACRTRAGIHPLLAQEFGMNTRDIQSLIESDFSRPAIARVVKSNAALGGLRHRPKSLGERNPNEQMDLFSRK